MQACESLCLLKHAEHVHYNRLRRPLTADGCPGTMNSNPKFADALLAIPVEHHKIRDYVDLGWYEVSCGEVNFAKIVKCKF